MTNLQINAYCLNSLDVIHENDKGLLFRNFYFKNCHYDPNTNTLVNEKSKDFDHTIKYLFILPQVTDTNNQSLIINFHNQNMYNKRYNMKFDEEKVTSTLYNKFLLTGVKVKKKNVNMMVSMGKSLLINVNPDILKDCENEKKGVSGIKHQETFDRDNLPAKSMTRKLSPMALKLIEEETEELEQKQGSPNSKKLRSLGKFVSSTMVTSYGGATEEKSNLRNKEKEKGKKSVTSSTMEMPGN